ncbi:choice-of-anchor Q domain-containing protein [Thiolapillus sp.]|uniref:choice-of-anchor Q domain-containing protein n=1 Tax=Thiolapillus sp. TaxID=2017437 RepID=UPI003AF75D80
MGSLRDVYNRIDPGDTVTFAPWLHGKTIELDAELRISKRMTIVGDIDADEKPDITISGKNAHRIFYVPKGITMHLRGVTLRYGRSSGDGGAIYNLGTIRMDNSRLQDNHAGRGGAVYNRGKIIIATSEALGNTVTIDGAVIYNEKTIDSLSRVYLTHSGFYHNSAKHQGGVVYNKGGDVDFIDLTLSDNRAVTGPGNAATAENRGSVLYQHGGHTEFRSVTMSGNISNPLTDVEDTYDDSFFGGDGNRTSAKEVQDGNRNRRKNNGGTIYNEGEWGQEEILLVNTVIEKSTGRNCGGLAGYNIGPNTWFDDNTCVAHISDRSDYEHQGTDRGDPKLGPLQNNGGITKSHTPYYDDPTHGTSGLIDPTAHHMCAAKDQRGALRIDRANGVHDRLCDIGSVEYGAIIPVPPVARTIDKQTPASARLHDLQDEMVALSNELHDTNHVPTILRVTNTNNAGLGSLRAQMGAAKRGDTIVFAPWLYDKTIWLNEDIHVSKAITINGDINGDRVPDITIRSTKNSRGEPVGRMLYVERTGTLTLKSVHLTGGIVRSMGGAIFSYGKVIIEYSHLDYNRAYDGWGGAIYSLGDVRVTHSTLDHNTADRQGGAIFTVLSTDGSSDGGGNLRIEGSTFEANVSVGNGGAVYNHRGTVYAINSTFAHNEAQVIGGRYSEGTVLYNEGGSVTLKHTTMANNQGPHASNSASNSVLYNQYPSSVPSYDNRDYNVHLINTIIAGVSSDNCEGGHFNSVNTWSDDASCGGSDRGEPHMGQLMDNGGPTKTMMPTSASAVVDGASSHCSPVDQRGAPRPSLQCDIGAIEVGASVPAAPAAHDINTVKPDYVREEDPNPPALPEPDTVETLGARIASLNTRIASLNGLIATLRGQIATLAATNATLMQGRAAQQVQIEQKTAHVARLEQQVSDLNGDLREKGDELEALTGPLSVAIGDAGRMRRIDITSSSGDVFNAMFEWHTLARTGSDANSTINMDTTTWGHVRKTPEGGYRSSGILAGENGKIYWTATSTLIPSSGFHVMRYEFWSAAAFGELYFGLYADIDIGNNPGGNALIVGGPGHPNRLLVTDSTDPTLGVALGLRNLRNARPVGWLGSPGQYYHWGAHILHSTRLVGADPSWGQFIPDVDTYGVADGYGPADVGLSLGIRIAPSAKLASFEITLVGAPDGHIE